MTITQHLEFSVLTAPLAAVDRRGLSQAWYSALYGQNGTGPKPLSTKAGAVARARSCSPHDHPAGRVTPLEKILEHPASIGRPANVTVAPEVDRRGPRSPLARKIERVFLHPRSPARSAAFALEGESGRVQVLLRSSGSNLKLVAICPRKAMKQVASALEQVRYALARRGIDLAAEMRDAAAC